MKQSHSARTRRKAIAIISRNHVLIRLPPSRQRMEFSETTSGNVGTLGAGWSVAGIGDLNRDGYSDILLQNNTTLALWEMNGTTILPGSGNIGTLGGGFQPVKT